MTTTDSQLDTNLRLPEQVETTWPVAEWRDVHVVVAVSGGADSVALLRTLRTLKDQSGGAGRLTVAHYNHRLRGPQADADAEWVRETSAGLGLPFELGVAPQEGPTDGSEQASRDARYAFLTSIAERLGARYLATAHTADDQVETVLMRLLRGTGIGGLAGVPLRRALSSTLTVVRPMLGVTREEVLADLHQLRQPFREDATNADQRYTRNRVRHGLLPLLREQFGDGVDAALIRTAEQAAEAQALIESEARRLGAAAIAGPPQDATIAIDRLPMQAARPLLVVEAVKLAWRDSGWPEQEMGRQQWRQLDRMIRTEEPPTAVDFPGGIHARRDAEVVRLTRR